MEIWCFKDSKMAILLCHSFIFYTFMCAVYSPISAVYFITPLVKFLPHNFRLYGTYVITHAHTYT